MRELKDVTQHSVILVRHSVVGMIEIIKKQTKNHLHIINKNDGPVLGLYIIFSVR